MAASKLAAVAAANVVVTMVRERETKNTWRYQEVEGPDGFKIGTLYVPKHVLAAMGQPEKITVTLAGA